MPSGIWLDTETYLQTAGQLWAQQQTQNVHAGVNWAQQAMQDTVGRLQQMVPQIPTTPTPAPAAPAPVAPPPVEAPPPTPMPAPPPVPIGGPTPAAGALPAPSDLTGAGITPPSPAPTPPPAPMPTPAPAPSTPDVGQTWAQQQIQNLLNPSAPPSSSTPTPGAQPIPGLGTGLPPSTPSPPASPAPTTGANVSAPGQLPPIDSSSPSAFAKSFAPYAQYAAQKLGVDPTWVAAMAASESNYGKAAGNELFGIKALPGQPGTSMQTHEGEYGGTQQNATFASYNSPLDAVDAYVDLLKKHYQGALGAQDLGTFVHGLKQGGYFTAAEDEYKGILSGISSRIGGDVQAGLQQAGTGIDAAKQAVGNAVTTGQTAVNTAVQGVQSAVARTSQFGMGLSSGDAMAFCGPAAAMAFAQSFGRNPTVAEAKQLAQQIGWNADQGMAGVGSEVNLLKAMGVDAHATAGVDWAQVGRDASGGNPVIIDTPGHYFYVDGYNAQTGQFHLGSSATDLKASGGKEWFTSDQIPGLGMGTPRAAIFADHPLAQSDGLAQSTARMTMGTMQPGSSTQPDLGSSIGQAVGNAPLPFLGGQSLSDISGLLGQNSQQLQQGRDLVGGILSPASSTSGVIQAKANSILQAVQDVGSQASQAGQDLLAQGQNALQSAQSDISQAPTTIQGILQQNAMTSQGIPNIGGQALEGAGNLLGQGQQALSGIGLQPGQSANLGPLQLGPMPADNSVLPLKLGGVDLTQPYSSDAATRALLGPNANPVVQSALSQALNPINAFFGPLGPLSGASAGAGGELARQQAESMGGDPTAQGVAQLAGGLAGGFAPSAVERALPAALSHGLGLMDVLSPPSVAYASSRGAPLEEQAAQIAGTVNPFALHTEPGPGRVPLGEDDIATHVEDLATRYEANDARIQQLQDQLTNRGTGDYSGQIVRPSWAVGWTDDALRALAKREGLNPNDPAWGSRAQDAAYQSGLKGTGATQLSPTAARAEIARLSAENQQLLDATDIPEGATTLYRGAPQAAADLPFAPYTAPDADVAGANPSSASQNPATAPGSAGAPAPVRATPGAVPSPTPAQTVTPPSTTAGGGAGGPPPGPGATAGPPPGGAPPVAPGAISAGDWLQGAYKGGVIGGLNTMADVASNATLSPILSAGAGYVRDLASLSPGRMAGRTLGAMSGITDWGNNFLAGLSDSLSRPTSLSARAGGGAPRIMANLIEGAGALHGAFQNATSELIQAMEQGAAAGDAAGNTIFSPGWKGNFSTELGRLPADVVGRAQAVGDRTAGRGDLGTLASAFGNFVNRAGPIGDALFPVYRMGMALGSRMVEASPLGLAGTGFDVARGLAGKGPYAAGLGSTPTGTAVGPLTERLTNNIIGTVASMWLANKALSGQVTGDGPTDPGQHQAWLANGNQPNSFIGPDGAYHSWQKLPPQLRGPLMTAGAYADAYQAYTKALATKQTAGPQAYGIEEPLTAAAWQLVSEIGRQVASATPMRTLADLYDAVGSSSNASGAGMSAAGDVASKVLGGMVPASGTVRSVAEMTDPTQRQTLTPRTLQELPQSVLEHVAQNIPGLREGLPARQDVLGRPISNPLQGLGELLPVKTAAGQQTPLLEAMQRLGVAPSGPPATIPYGPANELRLKPEEQRAFEQYRGQILERSAAPLVASPQFQQMQPYAQRAALERIDSAASSAAGRMVLADIVRTPGAAQSRQQSTGVLAPVVGYGPDILGNQFSDSGASARLAQHQALIQSLLGG